MSCERSTLHPRRDPQFQLIAGLNREVQGRYLISSSTEIDPPLKGGGWKA
jgi:hypothetical protein